MSAALQSAMELAQRPSFNSYPTAPRTGQKGIAGSSNPYQYPDAGVGGSNSRWRLPSQFTGQPSGCSATGGDGHTTASRDQHRSAWKSAGRSHIKLTELTDAGQSFTYPDILSPDIVSMKYIHIGVINLGEKVEALSNRNRAAPEDPAYISPCRAFAQLCDCLQVESEAP